MPVSVVYIYMGRGKKRSNRLIFGSDTQNLRAMIFRMFQLDFQMSGGFRLLKLFHIQQQFPVIFPYIFFFFSSQIVGPKNGNKIDMIESK